MKKTDSRSLHNKALMIMTVFLLFCPGFLLAQMVNFSGTWIQDTIKSDDFYKSFEVTYTITQTPQKFTVRQSFTLRGSKETMTDDYSFTLDGKTTTVKKESGMEKELAQWSPDKKTLTTRSTITYGNEDVGFTESYSLSGDGKVLTVVKSNIIPGVPSVKQVFTKKS